jgi:hypothetical protein
MFNSIYLKIVSVFAVLAAVFLFSFYYLLYIPGQEAVLTKELFTRVKNVAAVTGPDIVMAIMAKEDLPLVRKIESIKNLDDISAVYVLDKTGIVVIHDRTAEWGKVYDDSFSKGSIEKREISRKRLPGAKGYLTAVPLDLSYTLYVEASTQKISERIKLARKNGLYVIAIALILSSLFFAWFVNGIFRKRLRRLDKELRQIGLDLSSRIGPGDGPKDELAVLANEINALLDKFRDELGNVRAASFLELKNSRRILESLVACLEMGAAVVDSENRIIAINEKAKQAFNISPDSSISEKHFLDVFNGPDILNVLKKAALNKNVIITEALFDKKLRALTLSEPSGDIIGTVIVIL